MEGFGNRNEMNVEDGKSVGRELAAHVARANHGVGEELQTQLEQGDVYFSNSNC